MAEWFDMGRYAPFVWSSYGFTFLVIGGLFWHSLAGMRRSEREVEQLRAARGSRRRRAQRDAVTDADAPSSPDGGV